jgi:HK97 family phage portal protein
MSILDKVFRSKKSKSSSNIFDTTDMGLNYGSMGYNNRNAMMLSTVYRCVQVISDSIASIPIEVLNTKTKKKFTSHPTFNLLNKEPNSIMSRFTFTKLITSQLLLNGNAYAYIRRDSNGNVTELVYIPSDYVTVIYPNYLTPPTYSVVGFDTVLEQDQILHFLNYSVDGVNGISTLTNAKLTLNLAMNSEKHCANFFKSNANLNGILTVDSLLTTEQKKDIKKSWNSTFNGNDLNNSGIAVLEGNMKFAPVSVNSKDSQLLETRQFNVLDICRFFGVNPVKVFDLSKGSYNTVEALQLSFLTECLQPIMTALELEFERKLYKPSEKPFIDVVFDLSNFLRADLATRASYFSQLFQIGSITPNEIRKELNLNDIEGGDNAYIQVNMQKLNNVGVNNNIEK